MTDDRVHDGTRGQFHVPARREPWTGLDLTVLAALAALAAIAVGLGFAGASRLQPVAGLALILALAYCLSSSRRSIAWSWRRCTSSVWRSYATPPE